MATTYQILLGNCLTTLPTLPAESVQTCVTSPPYYGLRDYQTGIWEGGDGECDHQLNADNSKNAATSTQGGSRRNTGSALSGFRSTCGKCGAQRIDEQIGLEETVDDYVGRLVEVFGQVRRVLKPDGTLWVNLGDSYAGSGGAGEWSKRKGGKHEYAGPQGDNPNRFSQNIGLKPKDLIGAPWRVAFALQADGWWLRADVIWHKPNPMPSSATDRPTIAHEYLFLLSKSEHYFYDNEAIKEPSVTNDNRRPYGSKGAWALDGRPEEQRHGGEPRSRRDSFKREGSKREQVIPGQSVGTHRPEREESEWDITTRERRSVWTIPVARVGGAHFATFPPALVEPCILAGSRPGDLVLDPFTGSGTTGAVALKHHRNFVGCELNPDYIELAKRRIESEQPMLPLGAI